MLPASETYQVCEVSFLVAEANDSKSKCEFVLYHTYTIHRHTHLLKWCGYFNIAHVFVEHVAATNQIFVFSDLC